MNVSLRALFAVSLVWVQACATPRTEEATFIFDDDASGVDRAPAQFSGLLSRFRQKMVDYIIMHGLVEGEERGLQKVVVGEGEKAVEKILTRKASQEAVRKAEAQTDAFLVDFAKKNISVGDLKQSGLSEIKSVDDVFSVTLYKNEFGERTSREAAFVQKILTSGALSDKGFNSSFKNSAEKLLNSFVQTSAKSQVSGGLIASSYVYQKDGWVSLLSQKAYSRTNPLIIVEGNTADLFEVTVNGATRFVDRTQFLAQVLSRGTLVSEGKQVSRMVLKWSPREGLQIAKQGNVSAAASKQTKALYDRVIAEQSAELMDALKKYVPKGGSNPGTPGFTGIMSATQSPEKAKAFGQHPEEAIRFLDEFIQNRGNVAVIFDFPDAFLLKQPGVAGGMNHEILNTLRAIAGDGKWAARGSNFVFIVPDASSVQDSILNLAGVATVKITEPNLAQRRSYIENFLRNNPAVKARLGMTPAQLAERAEGLSIRFIQGLLSELRMPGAKKLLLEDLSEHVFDQLSRVTAGRVQMVKPYGDLESFRKSTATSDAVEMLMELAEKLVVNGGRDATTRASLFGGTGVGKTALLKAFAKKAREMGVHVVFLGEFRNMYVGNSELYLRQAINEVNKLSKTSPTIVFMDEAHDIFPRRSGAGDNSVEGRIGAMFKDWTSDDSLRGRITFIASTSYPNRLERDMANRFMTRVAFLPYLETASEKRNFLSVIFAKYKVNYDVSRLDDAFLDSLPTLMQRQVDELALNLKGEINVNFKYVSSKASAKLGKTVADMTLDDYVRWYLRDIRITSNQLESQLGMYDILLNISWDSKMPVRYQGMSRKDLQALVNELKAELEGAAAPALDPRLFENMAKELSEPGAGKAPGTGTVTANPEN